jgi:hypothetical protein
MIGNINILVNYYFNIYFLGIRRQIFICRNNKNNILYICYET